MTLLQIESIIDSQFPLVHDAKTKPLAYGTAGFRTAGELLPPVAARVVFIAVLRSCWCLKNSNHTSAKQYTGFMITASHNPAADNGFKIIDSDGGMLAPAWETYCGQAANCQTGEELVRLIQTCMTQENIATEWSDVNARTTSGVLLGRDTRPSGEDIITAVKSMLDLCGIPYRDHGVLTTPQLHYIVSEENKSTAAELSNFQFDTETYSRDVISAFDQLMRLGPRMDEPRKIIIDCSNGVGAIAMQKLLNGPDGDILKQYFDIQLVDTRTGDASVLNHLCGADFAKTNRVPSEEMQKVASELFNSDMQDDNTKKKDIHFYCFDGDADRIVAFHAVSPTHFELLDGDRIAILYAKYLNELLGQQRSALNMDIGIVQTAYANGASTDYVVDTLQMASHMAATGVKNLHPVAHKRDIGIYFEANGHGTVLFKNSACEQAIHTLADQNLASATALLYLPKLLSQVCGDAIGDFLACEAALHFLSLSFSDWLSFYDELPSRQLKVAVPFPKRIVTTPDETRAVLPDGLQSEIDDSVAAIVAEIGTAGKARCFVRPSGTEPIVRVYAEASTIEKCDELANRVKLITERYCS